MSLFIHGRFDLNRFCIVFEFRAWNVPCSHLLNSSLLYSFVRFGRWPRDGPHSTLRKTHPKVGIAIQLVYFYSVAMTSGNMDVWYKLYNRLLGLCLLSYEATCRLPPRATNDSFHVCGLSSHINLIPLFFFLTLSRRFGAWRGSGRKMASRLNEIHSLEKKKTFVRESWLLFSLPLLPNVCCCGLTARGILLENLGREGSCWIFFFSFFSHPFLSHFKNQENTTWELAAVRPLYGRDVTIPSRPFFFKDVPVFLFSL